MMLGLSRPAVAGLIVLLGLAPAGMADASEPGAPTALPGTGPAANAPAALDPGGLVGFFGNGLRWREQGSFGLEHARLMPDPSAPGAMALRVAYPEGSASPEAARSGAKPGGMQVYLPLGTPADTMNLSYLIRFEPGFRFVKGGKLPGLYGGSAGSGGQHRSDGFSTRFMWREGGAGEVNAYLPGKSGYGDPLGHATWRFTPGRWQRITQRVVLNTPGRSNGTLTVWLDGRRVFSTSTLNFRNRPDVHVDGLFFSTFFGGGDKSWASPDDQYADFAGFTLGPGDPSLR